jgi:prepilin-type N-terminal cleavage/methylation domain-containing protein
VLRKARKGFTLIEMLVVVGILVALTTLIGFAGPSLTRPAKVGAWEGSMKNLQEALMVFANANGERYPDPPTGTVDVKQWLTASKINGTAVSTPIGSYISKTIENPFYKDAVVGIVGSSGNAQPTEPTNSSLKAVDDPSLSTSTGGTGGSSSPVPVLEYDTWTDSNNVQHFIIFWKIGNDTKSLSDGVR